MIQFNLLPDVKVQYIRAQALKKTVFSVSFAVAVIALAIFAFVFLTVDVFQKKNLSDADKDVKNYTAQLNDIPDLDKIVTIQNQLNALVDLHQNKHVASRVFTYLPELTPAKLNVGKLTMDFSINVMDISGSADSLHTVNTFADTMKFTSFSLPGQNDKKPAFTSVILTSFGKDEKGATYSLEVTFDPALFSNNSRPLLVVPKEYTTRSVLAVPAADIFNGRVPTPSDNSQQGPGSQ